MKIKDIVSEAFGTQRVRDPSGTDYEKDPESGEYTGRTEINPRSFTNMIAGVADRVGAGSGSQWIKAPDNNSNSSVAVDRYQVPETRMLVVTSRTGKKYFKLPPNENSKDPSGAWTNDRGAEIADNRSIDILEQLARKNGKLVVDPKAVQAAQQAAQQGAQSQIVPVDEPIGEPSVAEPLHPDVSIVQSVPLVMQYKGKRFEMDDYGEFHPFGTTKKITPALQTFLTKERGKL